MVAEGTAPPLRPLRPGAWIKPAPLREHREQTFRILAQGPGAKPIDVHASCDCNEYISLRNRVLMECPPTRPSFEREARSLAHRIGTWVGRHDPADGEWIEKYSGRKRRVYQEARESLTLEPLSRRDYSVKSFVKPEKITDPTRDPRTIQARGPRYGVALGNYLKPLEHRLYRVTGSRNLRKWLPEGRLIAKGLDMVQRAELIVQRMDEFGCCLGIDASRFDAHVTTAMLSVEHSIYLRAHNGDKHLERMLQAQLVNRGITGSGIRYKCPGGRMSGDMNTALGNCMIVIITVAIAMRRLGLTTKQWSMLCDGDDTLIFVKPDLLELVRAGQIHTWGESGQEIKIECIAYTPEQVRFCQGSPVHTACGWKMISDPVRVLSRSLVSVDHFQHDKACGPLMRSIGLCEATLNSGTPVLQAWAHQILHNAGEGPVRGVENLGRAYQAGKLLQSSHPLYTPVTDEARLSYAAAFGVEPWEQILMERQIRQQRF